MRELLYKIEWPSIRRLRIGILCMYWHFLRAFPYSVIKSTQSPWDSGSWIEIITFLKTYHNWSGIPTLFIILLYWKNKLAWIVISVMSSLFFSIEIRLGGFRFTGIFIIFYFWGISIVLSSLLLYFKVENDINTF